MPPFQGAGAGQAVEDAFVLATLLRHALTTRSSVARALEIHSQVRVPVAKQVAETSRQNGRLYTMQDGESLEELGRKLQAAMDLTEEGDPVADAQRAVTMLEDVLGRRSSGA
jgi:salicylate hydroxylase